MNESLEGKTLAQKLRKVHTHTCACTRTHTQILCHTHACTRAGRQAVLSVTHPAVQCLCRAAFTKP